MGGCKETFHAGCCHWLATSAGFIDDLFMLNSSTTVEKKYPLNRSLGGFLSLDEANNNVSVISD